VGCSTCHQEVYKPLLGARMLDDYPALATSGKAAEEPAPAATEAAEGSAVKTALAE